MRAVLLARPYLYTSLKIYEEKGYAKNSLYDGDVIALEGEGGRNSPRAATA